MGNSKRSLKSNVSFLKNIFESEFFTKLSAPVCLITEENLAKAFSNELAQVIERSHKYPITVLTFPGGEENKTRKTKELLEDQMLDLKMTSDIHVVAFGGGVVLDLVGYLASTYLRGVALSYIPSTLLAMVDVAVGGKTAVNTDHGKNLIGSIYPPNNVFFDVNLLSNLPEKEWMNGSFEMIKHAILFDEKLFADFILMSQSSLAKLPEEKLIELISKNIEMKRKIVENDLYEFSLRKLLNFGHTIGHALEKLSDYQMSHGLCVGIGMWVESYLAWKKGKLSESCWNQINRFFKLDPALRIKTKKISFEKTSFLEAISYDKKRRGERGLYIEITGIGNASEKSIQPLDDKMLDAAYDFLMRL